LLWRIFPFHSWTSFSPSLSKVLIPAFSVNAWPLPMAMNLCANS